MYKHFGESAFLISKPLQLMIALCIAQQDAFEFKPVFIIIDAFSGAHEVSERLFSEFKLFQIPKYFTSRQLALTYLKKKKFDNIFIDSDVGLKNFLTLALFKVKYPKISIHVYEEGLGTYRTDLYCSVKKFLYGLVGIGAFFGACRFVNGIYIFCLKEYCQKIPNNEHKARQIKVNLSQYLRANLASVNRLFEFDGIRPKEVENLSCSIYLSDWEIDKKFLCYFKELDGDLFVKPHPYFKNNIVAEGVLCIDARVPAELIILDLMEKYQFVKVYDKNSSVRRYVSGKNLNFSLLDGY